MATAPCDCPKTTMWRTRSSTAQLSSPRLDTPLTTGTPPLHASFLLLPVYFTRRALSISLWCPNFIALKMQAVSSGDEKEPLKWGKTSDSALIAVLSRFFSPTLNLFCPCCCPFSWLHHPEAIALCVCGCGCMNNASQGNRNKANSCSALIQ